jgi:hypothetical protein
VSFHAFGKDVLLTLIKDERARKGTSHCGTTTSSGTLACSTSFYSFFFLRPMAPTSARPLANFHVEQGDTLNGEGDLSI